MQLRTRSLAWVFPILLSLLHVTSSSCPCWTVPSSVLDAQCSSRLPPATILTVSSSSTSSPRRGSAQGQLNNPPDFGDNPAAVDAYFFISFEYPTKVSFSTCNSVTLGGGVASTHISVFQGCLADDPLTVATRRVTSTHATDKLPFDYGSDNDWTDAIGCSLWENDLLNPGNYTVIVEGGDANVLPFSPIQLDYSFIYQCACGDAGFDCSSKNEVRPRTESSGGSGGGSGGGGSAPLRGPGTGILQGDMNDGLGSWTLLGDALKVEAAYIVTVPFPHMILVLDSCRETAVSALTSISSSSSTSVTIDPATTSVQATLFKQSCLASNMDARRFITPTLGGGGGGSTSTTTTLCGPYGGIFAQYADLPPGSYALTLTGDASNTILPSAWEVRWKLVCQCGWFGDDCSINEPIKSAVDFVGSLIGSYTSTSSRYGDPTFPEIFIRYSLWDYGRTIASPSTIHTDALIRAPPAVVVFDACAAGVAPAGAAVPTQIRVFGGTAYSSRTIDGGKTADTWSLMCPRTNMTRSVDIQFNEQWTWNDLPNTLLDEDGAPQVAEETTETNRNPFISTFPDTAATASCSRVVYPTLSAELPMSGDELYVMLEKTAAAGGNNGYALSWAASCPCYRRDDPYATGSCTGIIPHITANPFAFDRIPYEVYVGNITVTNEDAPNVFGGGHPQAYFELLLPQPAPHNIATFVVTTCNPATSVGAGGMGDTRLWISLSCPAGKYLSPRHMGIIAFNDDDISLSLSSSLSFSSSMKRSCSTARVDATSLLNDANNSARFHAIVDSPSASAGTVGLSYRWECACGWAGEGCDRRIRGETFGVLIIPPASSSITVPFDTSNGGSGSLNIAGGAGADTVFNLTIPRGLPLGTRMRLSTCVQYVDNDGDGNGNNVNVNGRDGMSIAGTTLYLLRNEANGKCLAGGVPLAEEALIATNDASMSATSIASGGLGCSAVEIIDPVPGIYYVVVESAVDLTTGLPTVSVGQLRYDLTCACGYSGPTCTPLPVVPSIPTGGASSNGVLSNTVNGISSSTVTSFGVTGALQGAAYVPTTSSSSSRYPFIQLPNNGGSFIPTFQLQLNETASLTLNSCTSGSLSGFRGKPGAVNVAMQLYQVCDGENGIEPRLVQQADDSLEYRGAFKWGCSAMLAQPLGKGLYYLRAWATRSTTVGVFQVDYNLAFSCDCSQVVTGGGSSSLQQLNSTGCRGDGAEAPLLTSPSGITTTAMLPTPLPPFLPYTDGYGNFISSFDETPEAASPSPTLNSRNTFYAITLPSNFNRSAMRIHFDTCNTLTRKGAWDTELRIWGPEMDLASLYPLITSPIISTSIQVNDADLSQDPNTALLQRQSNGQCFTSGRSRSSLYARAEAVDESLNNCGGIFGRAGAWLDLAPPSPFSAITAVPASPSYYLSANRTYWVEVLYGRSSISTGVSGSGGATGSFRLSYAVTCVCGYQGSGCTTSLPTSVATGFSGSLTGEITTTKGIDLYGVVDALEVYVVYASPISTIYDTLAPATVTLPPAARSKLPVSVTFSTCLPTQSLADTTLYVFAGNTCPAGYVSRASAASSYVAVNDNVGTGTSTRLCSEVTVPITQQETWVAIERSKASASGAYSFSWTASCSCFVVDALPVTNGNRCGIALPFVLLQPLTSATTPTSSLLGGGYYSGNSGLQTLPANGRSYLGGITVSPSGEAFFAWVNPAPRGTTPDVNILAVTFTTCNTVTIGAGGVLDTILTVFQGCVAGSGSSTGNIVAGGGSTAKYWTNDDASATQKCSRVTLDSATIAAMGGLPRLLTIAVEGPAAASTGNFRLDWSYVCKCGWGGPACTLPLTLAGYLARPPSGTYKAQVDVDTGSPQFMDVISSSLPDAVFTVSWGSSKTSKLRFSTCTETTTSGANATAIFIVEPSATSACLAGGTAAGTYSVVSFFRGSEARPCGWVNVTRPPSNGGSTYYVIVEGLYRTGMIGLSYSHECECGFTGPNCTVAVDTTPLSLPSSTSTSMSVQTTVPYGPQDLGFSGETHAPFRLYTLPLPVGLSERQALRLSTCNPETGASVRDTIVHTFLGCVGGGRNQTEALPVLQGSEDDTQDCSYSFLVPGGRSQASVVDILGGGVPAPGDGYSLPSTSGGTIAFSTPSTSSITIAVAGYEERNAGSLKMDYFFSCAAGYFGQTCQYGPFTPVSLYEVTTSSSSSSSFFYDLNSTSGTFLGTTNNAPNLLFGTGGDILFSHEFKWPTGKASFTICNTAAQSSALFAIRVSTVKWAGNLPTSSVIASAQAVPPASPSPSSSPVASSSSSSSSSPPAPSPAQRMLPDNNNNNNLLCATVDFRPVSRFINIAIELVSGATTPNPATGYSLTPVTGGAPFTLSWSTTCPCQMRDPLPNDSNNVTTMCGARLRDPWPYMQYFWGGYKYRYGAAVVAKDGVQRWGTSAPELYATWANPSLDSGTSTVNRIERVTFSTCYEGTTAGFGVRDTVMYAMSRCLAGGYSSLEQIGILAYNDDDTSKDVTTGSSSSTSSSSSSLCSKITLNSTILDNRDYTYIDLVFEAKNANSEYSLHPNATLEYGQAYMCKCGWIGNYCDSHVEEAVRLLAWPANDHTVYYDLDTRTDLDIVGDDATELLFEFTMHPGVDRMIFTTCTSPAASAQQAGTAASPSPSPSSTSTASTTSSSTPSPIGKGDDGAQPSRIPTPHKPVQRVSDTRITVLAANDLPGKCLAGGISMSDLPVLASANQTLNSDGVQQPCATLLFNRPKSASVNAELKFRLLVGGENGAQGLVRLTAHRVCICGRTGPNCTEDTSQSPIASALQGISGHIQGDMVKYGRSFVRDDMIVSLYSAGVIPRSDVTATATSQSLLPTTDGITVLHTVQVPSNVQALVVHTCSPFTSDSVYGAEDTSLAIFGGGLSTSGGGGGGSGGSASTAQQPQQSLCVSLGTPTSDMGILAFNDDAGSNLCPMNSYASWVSLPYPIAATYLIAVTSPRGHSGIYGLTWYSQCQCGRVGRACDEAAPPTSDNSLGTGKVGTVALLPVTNGAPIYADDGSGSPILYKSLLLSFTLSSIPAPGTQAIYVSTCRALNSASRGPVWLALASSSACLASGLPLSRYATYGFAVPSSDTLCTNLFIGNLTGGSYKLFAGFGPGMLSSTSMSNSGLSLDYHFGCACGRFGGDCATNVTIQPILANALTMSSTAAVNVPIAPSYWIGKPASGEAFFSVYVPASAASVTVTTCNAVTANGLRDTVLTLSLRCPAAATLASSSALSILGMNDDIISDAQVSAIYDPYAVSAGCSSVTIGREAAGNTVYIIVEGGDRAATNARAVRVDAIFQCDCGSGGAQCDERTANVPIALEPGFATSRIVNPVAEARALLQIKGITVLPLSASIGPNTASMTISTCTVATGNGAGSATFLLTAGASATCSDGGSRLPVTNILGVTIPNNPVKGLCTEAKINNPMSGTYEILVAAGIGGEGGGSSGSGSEVSNGAFPGVFGIDFRISCMCGFADVAGIGCTGVIGLPATGATGTLITDTSVAPRIFGPTSPRASIITFTPPRNAEGGYPSSITFSTCDPITAAGLRDTRVTIATGCLTAGLTLTQQSQSQTSSTSTATTGILSPWTVAAVDRTGKTGECSTLAVAGLKEGPYYIIVEGLGGRSGRFSLSWSAIIPTPSPSLIPQTTARVATPSPTPTSTPTPSVTPSPSPLPIVQAVISLEGVPASVVLQAAVGGTFRRGVATITGQLLDDIHISAITDLGTSVKFSEFSSELLRNVNLWSDGGSRVLDEERAEEKSANKEGVEEVEARKKPRHPPPTVSLHPVAASPASPSPLPSPPPLRRQLQSTVGVELTLRILARLNVPASLSNMGSGTISSAIAAGLVAAITNGTLLSNMPAFLAAVTQAGYNVSNIAGSVDIVNPYAPGPPTDIGSTSGADGTSVLIGAGVGSVILLIIGFVIYRCCFRRACQRRVLAIPFDGTQQNNMNKNRRNKHNDDAEDNEAEDEEEAGRTGNQQGSNKKKKGGGIMSQSPHGVGVRIMEEDDEDDDDGDNSDFSEDDGDIGRGQRRKKSRQKSISSAGGGSITQQNKKASPSSFGGSSGMRSWPEAETYNKGRTTLRIINTAPVASTLPPITPRRGTVMIGTSDDTPSFSSSPSSASSSSVAVSKGGNTTLPIGALSSSSSPSVAPMAITSSLSPFSTTTSSSSAMAASASAAAGAVSAVASGIVAGLIGAGSSIGASASSSSSLSLSQQQHRKGFMPLGAMNDEFETALASTSRVNTTVTSKGEGKEDKDTTSTSPGSKDTLTKNVSSKNRIDSVASVSTLLAGAESMMSVLTMTTATNMTDASDLPKKKKKKVVKKASSVLPIDGNGEAETIPIVGSSTATATDDLSSTVATSATVVSVKKKKKKATIVPILEAPAGGGGGVVDGMGVMTGRTETAASNTGLLSSMNTSGEGGSTLFSSDDRANTMLTMMLPTSASNTVSDAPKKVVKKKKKKVTTESVPSEQSFVTSSPHEEVKIDSALITVTTTQKVGNISPNTDLAELLSFSAPPEAVKSAQNTVTTSSTDLLKFDDATPSSSMTTATSIASIGAALVAGESYSSSLSPSIKIGGNASSTSAAAVPLLPGPGMSRLNAAKATAESKHNNRNDSFTSELNGLFSSSSSSSSSAAAAVAAFDDVVNFGSVNNESSVASSLGMDSAVDRGMASIRATPGSSSSSSIVAASQSSPSSPGNSVGGFTYSSPSSATSLPPLSKHMRRPLPPSSGFLIPSVLDDDDDDDKNNDNENNKHHAQQMAASEKPADEADDDDIYNFGSAITNSNNILSSREIQQKKKKTKQPVSSSSSSSSTTSGNVQMLTISNNTTTISSTITTMNNPFESSLNTDSAFGVPTSANSNNNNNNNNNKSTNNSNFNNGLSSSSSSLIFEDAFTNSSYNNNTRQQQQAPRDSPPIRAVSSAWGTDSVSISNDSNPVNSTTSSPEYRNGGGNEYMRTSGNLNSASNSLGNNNGSSNNNTNTNSNSNSINMSSLDYISRPNNCTSDFLRPSTSSMTGRAVLAGGGGGANSSSSGSGGSRRFLPGIGMLAMSSAGPSSGLSSNSNNNNNNYSFDSSVNSSVNSVAPGMTDGDDDNSTRGGGFYTQQGSPQQQQQRGGGGGLLLPTSTPSPDTTSRVPTKEDLNSFLR